MIRLTLFLTVLLWSTISFSQNVNTNGSGEATSVTSLYIDGMLYNVTSFDGTGSGSTFFWPDATTATAAANALNAALTTAGVSEVANSGTGFEKATNCVGVTTGIVSDSIGSIYAGGDWNIDAGFGSIACTNGGVPFHTTWVVTPPPPAGAGTVHFDTSGNATAITGIEIGGNLYNVTSFDGTGAGEAYFWLSQGTAEAAGNAVNAALNAAGVNQVANGAAGTSSGFQCVGRTTGDDADSVASTSEASSSDWIIDTIIAPYACVTGGLPYYTTWEQVPAGTVNTNGAGEVTSITDIDVGGVLYNVTSFDGTGDGTAYFWSNGFSAEVAATAINAVLNGAGVTTAAVGGTAKGYHCVGVVGGDHLESSESATYFTFTYWQLDEVVGPYACNYGGLSYHTTWEVSSTTLSPSIAISAGAGLNIIYPENPDQLISVVILKSLMQVGDPIDFDTDTIDPSTVIFGPNQASIAANSNPEFNVDYDADGLTDAKFEFRTGDTGFTCDDTQAAISGQTTTGQPFVGIDTVDTNCEASICHP